LSPYSKSRGWEPKNEVQQTPTPPQHCSHPLHPPSGPFSRGRSGEPLLDSWWSFLPRTHERQRRLPFSTDVPPLWLPRLAAWSSSSMVRTLGAGGRGQACAAGGERSLGHLRAEKRKGGRTGEGRGHLTSPSNRAWSAVALSGPLHHQRTPALDRSLCMSVSIDPRQIRRWGMRRPWPGRSSTGAASAPGRSSAAHGPLVAPHPVTTARRSPSPCALGSTRSSAAGLGAPPIA
jgi:hypothetical protein